MELLLRECSRIGRTGDAALVFPEAPAPLPAEAGRRMPGNLPASCLLHGIFLAALFALSPAPAELPPTTVYRIVLTDIVLPAQTGGAHASSLSESAPQQPAPEPAAATRQERKPGAEKKKETRKPPAEQASAPSAEAAAPAPPAAAAPSGDAPLTIGGFAAYGEDAVDQPPSVTAQVAPEYPQRARRMNIEGRVDIRLVVDEAGKPQACAVQKAEPAGYFEEAALAAARKTRFLPGKLRGRPVNTLVHISFVFVLS